MRSRKSTLFYLFLSFMLLLEWAQAAGSTQERPAALTFIVYLSNDAGDAAVGDGICSILFPPNPATCTLRAAVEEANAHSVGSTIIFAGKFTSANYIMLGSHLPVYGNGITIDAGSQWDGTWPNGEPGVEIRGHMEIWGNNCGVSGILFTGAVDSLEVRGNNDTIGGPGPGQRNVFISSGTNVSRVYVYGGTGNQVLQNYFGTRDGQTPFSFSAKYNIFFQTDQSTAEGNVIGGASDSGILIWGNSSTISNNIIGATATKSGALPNAIGLYILGSLGTPGANVIHGNFIAGNTGHGIYLKRSSNNLLLGNQIGYAQTGLGNGGDGINLFDSDNNQFGGISASVANLIYNNSGNGIGYTSGAGDSEGSVIVGNYIIGNGENGILVPGSLTAIGGPGNSERNYIGSNSGNGIYVSGAFHDVVIINNYIGLDPTSGVYDYGNLMNGVMLDGGAYSNRVGSDIINQGNSIGFNHLDGIRISGGTTHDNVVMGNVIGAPVNWDWPAPNLRDGIGLANGTYSNTIGGSGRFDRNTIVSNGYSGVYINGASNNVIGGNLIGTNTGGTTAFGNPYYGIKVVGSSTGNAISLNKIAYNGSHANEAGVRIEGSSAISNRLHANRIHDNGGAGIELISGGNNSLAAPVISSASCQSASGTACANCLVEIFSDNANEGQYYEGYVTASAVGAFSWTGSLHGPKVTATATQLSTSDTSSFSPLFTIGSCSIPRLFLPLVQK